MKLTRVVVVKLTRVVVVCNQLEVIYKDRGRPSFANKGKIPKAEWEINKAKQKEGAMFVQEDKKHYKARRCGYIARAYWIYKIIRNMEFRMNEIENIDKTQQ